MRTFFLHALTIVEAMSMGIFINAAHATQDVIDILAVYTPGAANIYQGDPTTRINHLLQVTNQIYQDSELNVEFRLVKTMLVDYPDNNAGDIALRDITYAQQAVFNEVENVRQVVGADMVIFYRPFTSEHGSCGHAWVIGEGAQGDFSDPTFKNYMYSHVPLNSCGDFSTAHELGHNMGLRHSRRQDGTGASFPFAVGYGVDNLFSTIMAFQSEFNVDYWEGKAYKFSSPALSCKGQPCGIDKNDLHNGADNRYAVSIIAPQIANYFSAVSSSTASSLSSSVTDKTPGETYDSGNHRGGGSISMLTLLLLVMTSVLKRFYSTPINKTYQ